MDKNLGHATAYGYAKSKGYTGTEEEFAELMASYASVAESAAASAAAAAESATTAGAAEASAVAAKTAAETASGTANTKASEASASATSAASSASAAEAASTMATAKASEASTAAQTATTKASEASTSATAAGTAQTAAETAQTAAEDAADRAEEAAETFTTDTTLTIAGKAADAKATGDKIRNALPLETASGAIASFPDGSDLFPAESCKVSIAPVQDLHGYDAPWPAGGGKNKFNVTATTQTLNGVTFTIENGTVKANGTASGNSILLLGTVTLSAGNYIANGITNGDAGRYLMRVHSEATTIKYIYDGDTAFTLEQETELSFSIYIYNGVSVSNKMFYPMIRLASVTDDTFAPYSNICPITGWDGVNVTKAGKNLFDSDTVYGRYKQVDGSYHIVADSITQIHANIPQVLVGKTLTFSALVKSSDSTATNIRVAVVVNGVETKGNPVNTTYYQLTSVTFTPTSTDDYIRITYGNGGTGFVDVRDIQLEIGSTATPYEPYTGSTISVTFPSEIGMVYGGSLDLVSGDLVVTHKYYTNSGTGSWGEVTTNGARYYIGGVSSDCVNASINGACNIGNLVTDFYGNGVCVTDNGRINLCGSVHDAFTTVDALKTYLASNPLEVAYELATPITYHLTPQEVSILLGYNNVWANSGDTEVKYRADVQRYIEKKLAEIEALILEN